MMLNEVISILKYLNASRMLIKMSYLYQYTRRHLKFYFYRKLDPEDLKPRAGSEKEGL